MNFSVAIGDIHGMAEKLRRLLAQIEAWRASRGAPASLQFIFLGDYVDRGPDSRSVLDQVRAMQQDGAICLRGNHEQMMIDATELEVDLQRFLRNGGHSTLASLARPAAFAEAQGWMTRLPVFHEDSLRYYVHAGVRPRVPFDRQDDETRLWIREEFLAHRGAFAKYVVHGHTPTVSLNADQTTPDIRDNRCNVDTGAGWGAALSAAIFDDRQAPPIHTISAF